MDKGKWDMPGSMYADAKLWYEMVVNDSYFSKALMMAWTMGGVSGCLVAVSTPDSNRAFQQSLRDNARGGMITAPEWCFYTVFWFAGLVLLNFAGIGQRKYNGTELEMPLGILLRTACESQGIQFLPYVQITGGSYHRSLRQLLYDLGIFAHLEITTGLSWRAYRGLDAYLKVFSGASEPPLEEAHFVLNTKYPVWARQLLSPEEWWKCVVWHSVGQRESITEHDLLDIRMIGQMSRL